MCQTNNVNIEMLIKTIEEQIKIIEDYEEYKLKTNEIISLIMNKIVSTFGNGDIDIGINLLNSIDGVECVKKDGSVSIMID